MKPPSAYHLLTCGLLALLAACGDEMSMPDGSASVDGGLDLGAPADGAPPLRGAFTIVGCQTLDQSLPEPVCSGPAPLELTFVPLSTGATELVWAFDGAEPPASMLVTPTVVYRQPGTYEVSLAVGGPSGVARAVGTVHVLAGGLGAACSSASDCDAALGLTCACAGGSCPGALGGGFCTRACGPSACAPGELCADLTLGGAAVDPADGGVEPSDGGAGDSWRRALCVRACTTDAQCREGLRCLELPALAPGAMPGGPHTWQKGCFAEVSGEIGESCFDGSGQPDGSRCLSGLCEPLGARGLCAAVCGAGAACPASAACATFSGAPGRPLCLRRCDAAHPCEDPLLACEPAGKTGDFGFTVPAGEPAAAIYCAPKRCTAAADCAPAGTCTPLGDGSFCTRL